MSKSKRGLLLDMCWTSPVALKSLLILSWISAELFSLEQNWWKSKRRCGDDRGVRCQWAPRKSGLISPDPSLSLFTSKVSAEIGKVNGTATAGTIVKVNVNIHIRPNPSPTSLHFHFKETSNKICNRICANFRINWQQRPLVRLIRRSSEKFCE